MGIMRELTHRISSAALAAVIVLGCSAFAHGAVLCVSASGSVPPWKAREIGCAPTIFRTIGAAVAASKSSGTVAVFKGTYSEMVTIPASLPGLSLIAEDRRQVIINAENRTNGILDQASFVTISGFQIENALHEGILVQGPAAVCGGGSCSPSAPQITNVTIADNWIHHNDLGLTETLTCPGAPDFEQFDCGEGVHLDGVAYSTASNNEVEHNSGGFLLTDETNSNHDNVVNGNEVEDNLTDCGITLPSHPPNGANANIGTPSFKVFNDTVADNLSKHNGAAGTGVFTPTPGTASYQHLIINNRLIDNGEPGVIFHEHAPGEILNNVSIIGNLIEGNGADPAPGPPTETNGPADPTGIEVYADVAAQPISGLKIEGNTFNDETYDIWVGAPDWHNCGTAQTPCYVVAAHLNDFKSNNVGVNNTGRPADVLVDASLNFWGCKNGPGTPGCATVEGNVISVPFLTLRH